MKELNEGNTVCIYSLPRRGHENTSINEGNIRPVFIPKQDEVIRAKALMKTS